MAPIDESARKRAQDMEKILELARDDQQDTVALMERLDKLASELFEHALDWDSVDPEVAARVRKQAEQVHSMHKRVEKLAELEIEEASQIMSEIRRILKEARGEG